MEMDRAVALRTALQACRNGGTVSVAGVYGGFIDKMPMGGIMNRGLTIKTGQTHVQQLHAPAARSHPEGRDRPQLHHHPPPPAATRRPTATRSSATSWKTA